VVTPGLKTCQLGLRFGGNDVGSIMIEENVVSAAGAHHCATEESCAASFATRALCRSSGTLCIDLLLELVTVFHDRLPVAALTP